MQAPRRTFRLAHAASGPPLVSRFDAAASVAVSKASETVRNIKSVYIKEMNAAVSDGKITSYRVNAKITFLLDDQAAT